MRFLLDQDVYAVTAQFLIHLGHDVVKVAQIGLSQADDEDLLKIAREQDRIFVTRDRDFGNLVFVRALGPERTRSLPKRYRHLRYKNFCM